MAIKDLNEQRNDPTKPLGVTAPPDSEAMSHKPTFGEASELPERTEPAGDTTIDFEEDLDSAKTTIDRLAAGGDNAERGLDPDTIDPDTGQRVPEHGGLNRLQVKPDDWQPPEGDPAPTKSNLTLDEAEKLTAKDVGADTDPDNAAAFDRLPPESKRELYQWALEQKTQHNPDNYQDNPLAAPKRGPVTLDPMTGQIVHAGELSELPSSQIGAEVTATPDEKNQPL